MTSSLVWISNPTSQQFYTRRLRRHYFKIILFWYLWLYRKTYHIKFKPIRLTKNKTKIMDWYHWKISDNFGEQNKILFSLFLQKQFSENRPKNNSAALNIDWVSLLFLIHYFKVWPKSLFKVVKCSYVDLTSFILLSFLKRLSKIFLETCKMHLLVDLRLFLGSSVCRNTYILATC